MSHLGMPDKFVVAGYTGPTTLAVETLYLLCRGTVGGIYYRQTMQLMCLRSVTIGLVGFNGTMLDTQEKRGEGLGANLHNYVHGRHGRSI